MANPDYKKPKKLKPIKTLDNKLWTLYSKFIRLRDSDANGYVTCYTCYKRYLWNDVDAGHYEKRQYKGTKFDDRNVKPQCRGCNRFKGGMQAEFARHLEEDYGYGILQALARDRDKEMTRDKYELLITAIKELLKDYDRTQTI